MRAATVKKKNYHLCFACYDIVYLICVSNVFPRFIFIWVKLQSVADTVWYTPMAPLSSATLPLHLHWEGGTDLCQHLGYMKTDFSHISHPGLDWQALWFLTTAEWTVNVFYPCRQCQVTFLLSAHQTVKGEATLTSGFKSPYLHPETKLFRFNA